MADRPELITTVPSRSPLGHWVAWAKGPAGVRAEGTGETPEAALYRLSQRLAGLRGSLSG